jgi:hypothetical protein
VLGASAVLKMNNVSSTVSQGMAVIDFDKDFKEDVL